MSPKKRRTSKEKIRRIGNILEEFLVGNLESEFPVSAPGNGLPGAGEPEVEVEGAPGEPANEAAEPGVDEEGAEAEQYDETKFYFDLADVEYCVDVAITQIIAEKLVTGYDDPRTPPTLSDIFQALFGEEDSLTKRVDEFEELISGYDDHVHIDDLQQAHNVMSEIIKELEDRSKN